MTGRALLHLAVHGEFPGRRWCRHTEGLHLLPPSSPHVKATIAMFFRPSLSRILSSLDKLVGNLEAHVERKCDHADATRAKAAQKRIEAKALDNEANAHEDEAAQAARVSSRIQSLLS